MAAEREVLNAKLLLKMSQKINPTEVSVKAFSIHLGFEGASGSNALITNMVLLNPQDAYHDLLQKFVYKHGTREKGALKLYKILRENDIKPAAELLEDELRRLEIEFYDHGQEVPQLPTPPSESPGNHDQSDSAVGAQGTQREQPLSAEPMEH